MAAGGPLQVVCPQCDGVNRLPAERLHDHPHCGRCKAELFVGHPTRLTGGNFDKQLTRGDLPVVVDFWAPWCAPCTVMAPVFEQAARVLEPGLRFAKLNTEEAPEVSGRLNIRSIPTLILFHRGREVARQSGALPGPALMNWLRTHTPA